MQKIGFLGMGVMGLPMAKNVVQKCGLPVLGYDVVQQQMDAFREAGGIPVSDPAEIYKACDVILQILPTHPIIRNSVEQAIQYGKPGNVIVDLSSTAPDIILELYQQAKDAGMFLLDSPVSGGNPMAIAGTLAIMTGGDKEAFDKVKPVLACMGSPVYTGGPRQRQRHQAGEQHDRRRHPGGHCGGLCLRGQGGHRPADHVRGHPGRLCRRSHVRQQGAQDH